MEHFFPIAASVLGVSVLYAGWSRRLEQRVAANVIGWGLITISVFLWIPVHGPEFGSVYAFMVFPLAAWVLAIANPGQGNGRTRTPVRERISAPSMRTAFSHALLFFVALPVAAISSALLAIELSSWIAWSDVDRIVAGLLAMPIIWGALSYWVCAAQKPLKPALAIFLSGTLSALALYT